MQQTATDRRQTEIVDVWVEAETLERAKELADEENIAVEDAIARLVKVVPAWNWDSPPRRND